MTGSRKFILPIMFWLALTLLSACNRHPERNLILDLEKGEAKIDSKDLIIVEFNIERIDNVRYREVKNSIHEATTKIIFPSISEAQFNDTTLSYPDLTVNVWAIDTMRNQEYYFYTTYTTWEEARKDTTDSFDGVAAPKYIDNR